MSTEAWLLFCATETVLCLTPGPAVLLVLSLSLTRGGRGGLLASLGILLCNAIYFAISATSIGGLLLASSRLFLVVKWVGAAYLIYTGVSMIVGARSAAAESSTNEAPRSGLRPFTDGLITQGANPKAIVYFTALLPQFVDPQAAIAPQVVALGMVSVAIEFTVLTLYVALASRVRGAVDGPAPQAWLARGGGALLIGAGAGLARMPGISKLLP